VRKDRSRSTPVPSCGVSMGHSTRECKTNGEPCCSRLLTSSADANPLRPHNPTHNRRIIPAAWSSRLRYIGIEGRRCPISQPMSCST
jgi:hypothetical protein